MLRKLPCEWGTCLASSPTPTPPRLLPLLNAGRQRPKRGSRRGGHRNGHTGLPSPHFSPTRPKSERRPRAGSLAGWVPSPVLQLNLEPKVLPARAELVPRYPKLALLPLPAQLRAADPALAGPPRLGWSRGPFPAPQAFGPGPPPPTSSFRVGRPQCPVPRHPLPPGLQARSSFPPPGPQLRCHRGRFPRAPPGF